MGIIYGALVAMVQPDLKKLVAYSSIAHLGFCVLGVYVFQPEAMEGAIYQMFSHGVSTGALFMLVGMLYERRHTRLISDFGGLATSVPVYSTFFLIVVLSSLGLPLLNGFIGEFLIIVGSFYRHPAYAAFAAVGVVLAAVYLLWMYQRVFYGEPTNEKNRILPDCDFREKLILTVMVIVIIAMGVYPQPFLRRMDHTVNPLIQRIEGRSTSMAERGVAPIPKSPLSASHAPRAYCLLPTACSFGRGWTMITAGQLTLYAFCRRSSSSSSLCWSWFWSPLWATATRSCWVGWLCWVCLPQAPPPPGFLSSPGRAGARLWGICNQRRIQLLFHPICFCSWRPW